MTRWGRLDTAVANAGILRAAPFAAMTDEQWDDVLQVDLHGVMRTARAAVAHLGAGGSIVAVSSIAGGVYGWAEHAHYATAKAGVHRPGAQPGRRVRPAGYPRERDHPRPHRDARSRWTR